MSEPGTGPGWEKLALRVAELLPAADIDGLWVFPPLRQDQREWGTAVLTRVEGEQGERRRIYTARFMLQVKGKERGKFESWVQEVGSGPAEALEQLLRDAQRRIDDDQPPVPVPPEEWFAAAADAPAH